jgi:hypothetical protein
MYPAYAVVAGTPAQMHHLIQQQQHQPQQHQPQQHQPQQHQPQQHQPQQHQPQQYQPQQQQPQQQQQTQTQQQPPAGGVGAAYPYFPSSYFPSPVMMMQHHPSSPYGMLPPMMAVSSPGIPLALPNDGERLSEYQTILRQQFEFFQAGPLDAQTTAQGRKRPVVIGQGELSVCSLFASNPPKNIVNSRLFVWQ